MSTPPIQARHLRRTYGDHVAVADISFVVPKGRVLALLGRNGAGKTTTMRMLAGLLPPSGGRAMLFGESAFDLSPAARGRIGYMAEGAALFRRMRVGQLIGFQRRFYPRFDDALCSRICDGFRLQMDQQVGSLSHGQRAGLYLAVTLAPHPEVLLLDDPLMGLDPAARRLMLECMVHFAQQVACAVVFSSHLLDDVERVADAVAILDRGRLRACCDLATFQNGILQFLVEDEGAAERFAEVPGLLSSRALHQGGHRLIIQGDEGVVHDALRAAGATQLERVDLSFEEAAIACMGGTSLVATIAAGSSVPSNDTPFDDAPLEDPPLNESSSSESLSGDRSAQ